MYNLLITGGTGFWGKNVLKKIINIQKYNKEFRKIYILTRDSKKFINNYPELIDKKFEFFESDVREFKTDKTDFHYIFHFAMDASKDLNDNNPLEMMDVILNGTKNILKIAKNQNNLKKFVYASTGAVYGDIPENINGVKEEDRFDLNFNDPKNAHSMAKRTAELMCSICIEKYKIPILIVRGFSARGEYLPEDMHFAMGNFIKKAREEKKITIESDGMVIRSYIDAGVMAEYLLELLLKEKNIFNIYNLGSPDGKTLKEWAEIIAKEFGNVEIEILNRPQKGFYASKNYYPNVDRIKNEIKLK